VEPMRNVIHHVQIYHFAKFEIFWISRKQKIWIYKIRVVFLDN
jgi:hypothetical protein